MGVFQRRMGSKCDGDEGVAGRHDHLTMAHELKHHLVDSTLEIRSQWGLEAPNPIEVSAEIFASELIYPEQDFRSDLHRMESIGPNSRQKVCCG